MELPHCMDWSFTQCNSWNSHICDCNLINLISGRWNSHFMWQADVVAMVADVMATGWMCLADVIAMVADVIATGHYFNFSSVLLTRTSSHIWGRWYLPMFLFRDGLLTLMNIDSLISLERFCSSLPTTVKLLIVVEWPEMLLWSNMGEGAFRCSLNLSPNVLAVSPIYSWSHSNLSHLYLYIIPLFLVIWS